MDAITKQLDQLNPQVGAAILKGVEIRFALSSNSSSVPVVLSSLIVDLVEGKDGAKEQVISLFKAGIEEIEQNAMNDDPLLFLDYSLNKAVKTKAVQAQLRKIFMLWPNLKMVTERFCYYVTPLLGGTGMNLLLEESLVNAIKAYQTEPVESRKVQAYILGLAGQAHLLVSVSIKGKYSRGFVTWIPFSQPITDWMKKYKLKTIKTTEQTCPCLAETAQVLLMSQILTVEDLEVANLRFVVGSRNA